MRKKAVWLILSCLMAVALVLTSCGPAEVEEEEEVTPVEEEEVTPEEEEEVEVVEEEEMVVDAFGRLVEKPKYGGTVTFYMSSGAMENIDPVRSAMSGWMRLTADGMDPEAPPIRPAEWHGDLDPALFAVIGILGALRHRDRTGEGQLVDVAQLDCMVAQCGVSVTGYLMSGMLPWEMRKKYMGLRFIGAFKALDGYVYIHTSPAMDERLKRGMGVEELEKKEELGSWVEQRTVQEVVDALVEADVPVAPCYHINQVVEDPQVQARGMIVSMEHPTAGTVREPRFPIKFSKTPARIVRPAPLLGQHNEEILTELGYTAEEISEMRREGITT